MSTFEHLLMKVRDASAAGINGMSTGEALAAALVLNRSDWLEAMGYTIAEALDRIDKEWIAYIPQAAKMVEAADAYIADARKSASEQSKLALLDSGDETIRVAASLVTCGNAPGYRDVSLTFDIRRLGDSNKIRLSMAISPDDGERTVSHILDVHRFAWRNGKPIDQREGEGRPNWIDRP